MIEFILNLLTDGFSGWVAGALAIFIGAIGLYTKGRKDSTQIAKADQLERDYKELEKTNAQIDNARRVRRDTNNDRVRNSRFDRDSKRK